jgi:hypothetical protein
MCHSPDFIKPFPSTKFKAGHIYITNLHLLAAIHLGFPEREFNPLSAQNSRWREAIYVFYCHDDYY